ncbi:MAG: VOC family protein [Bacteroidetes bacterium]|nr:VOC family protein [Bacteroidota bacterium]
MANAINWFEIPASDFSRAKNFYQDILGVEFHIFSSEGTEMAFFPEDREQYGSCGALIYEKGRKPSQEGTVVYLNAGDDLSEPLSKVEDAGGKVILPRTSIGENGYIAHFIDTEGNRVALHSMK